MGILITVFRRKWSKPEETSLTEDQLSTFEVRSEYSSEFFEIISPQSTFSITLIR